MTTRVPVQEAHSETLSSGLDFLWAEITGRCQLACGPLLQRLGPVGHPRHHDPA